MSELRQTIVLASTSPRRAKLLRDAGVVFEQTAPGFDDGELDFGALPVRRVVEAFALMKAKDVAADRERSVVIGSDTMIRLAGKPIGKPRDADDARAILEALIGNPHEVVTGVAMVSSDGPHASVFHDATRIEIKHPGESVLNAYLDSNAWQGKAGGYNLAELENQWRFTVTGDPTTVVGLPMQRLLPAIRRFVNLLTSP